MPWDEKTKRYSWPALYETPRPEIATALKEWRRFYVNERTEWLALEKEFKDNKEVRKIFKELAAEMMRYERACTFMLPYFEGLKDPTPHQRWPKELESELDSVAYGIIYLDFEENRRHMTFNRGWY